MGESKNLLLAITLSMLVMVGWQYFVLKPKHEAEAKLKQEQIKTATDNARVLGDSAPVVPEKLQDRSELLVAEKASRFRIASETVHGSISTLGARIDDLTLANYHIYQDKKSPEVALLSPANSEQMYFAEFGWLPMAAGVSAPVASTQWKKISGDVLAPNKPLVFEWISQEGIRYTQTFTLDERYMFAVKLDVENGSKTPISLAPYGMINRARDDHKAVYISHEGFLGVFDSILEEITYDTLKEDKQKEYKDKKGWFGIADQYWLTAILPPRDEAVSVTTKFYEKDGKKRYQADYVATVRAVKSGEKISYSQQFYAGAKKVNWLDEYAEEQQIPLFDRSVDYGIFYFLTKPMYKALIFFQSHMGNFGLAILMLTICIKMLLFPLANKSYKSMAQMRLVMPEMKELQEKYKDDRARLNQEMMTFYQKRKINPAAGCMPILLQIPIFFSLYKTLYVTIEMRHAPFYGWIHDLSAPDPTNILQLFGLLEWMPPLWLPHIGVLPIVFMITMFIQQALNPPPADPTQKIIMRWMPVVFLFLFASFPAGLVIYWIWSNILSILQQYVITRKLHPHTKH